MPFATGYVEGNYVEIAPVATAQILALPVASGDRVASGQTLVELERRDAEIALAQAEAALSRAESQLADLRQGKRPEEIRVIEASLASARAQAEEARRTADRLLGLAGRGVATETQRDDAATAAAVAEARVTEIEANLAVARLPARPDEIAASEAALREATAARDHARWQLDKRALTAPSDGMVTDIIRRPGEIAVAGQPVLALLPDGAIRLRLYVPEADIARIAPGDRLALSCDSCPPNLSATISYIADGPEFTPPVIYSVDSRQKLVYLVEATPADGSSLKPGQIVDVDLPEGAP
ncbi:HlyD family efflux transporter periplasmic adaptor subunit [Tabrizicola sp.]|uniref:HlyD family secretion protein n=1 Tax=Tabrizicola sp. TaxID=2005166 RepID=UPI001A63C986|nr:HlyD family efflux transporter periplasmic adaptor subunit [Tabrizicola sp.]MBL9074692.1 HlyD family efflux transporter periplasmic adaptor subunit [Tabrizicola sp.]